MGSAQVHPQALSGTPAPSELVAMEKHLSLPICLEATWAHTFTMLKHAHVQGNSSFLLLLPLIIIIKLTITITAIVILI
jgi:hypothetical protein